jgi:arginase family enzyme
MSDIQHFFQSIEFVENSNYENKLGGIINAYTKNGNFPDLSDIDMAIVGVCESRYSANSGSQLAPDSVRTYLYDLYQGSFRARIVDLGNIEQGHEVDDTYYALKTTVEYLIKNNIIPIIIGGSQDLTYAQFLGYENLEQTINIATVDSAFDIGSPEEQITNKGY